MTARPGQGALSAQYQKCTDIVITPPPRPLFGGQPGSDLDPLRT